jgi:uncharacterized protein Yka (UPF0111/DUF47 family)
MEAELTRAIFARDDLDLSRKLHLRQCVERLALLSDRAEIAADRLELAALKSIV